MLFSVCFLCLTVYAHNPTRTKTLKSMKPMCLCQSRKQRARLATEANSAQDYAAESSFSEALTTMEIFSLTDMSSLVLKAHGSTGMMVKTKTKSRKK